MLPFLVQPGAQMDTTEKVHTFYQIYDLLEAAKKPVLVFIDEIDAVFMNRHDATDDTRKLLSAFLEKVSSPSTAYIKWVGATNFLDDLDLSVKSRFSMTKYVGKPNAITAQKLLKTYLVKEVSKNGFNSIDIPFLGDDIECRGLTGRDIESFSKVAAKQWRLADKKSISESDITSTFYERFGSIADGEDTLSKHTETTFLSYIEEIMNPGWIFFGVILILILSLLMLLGGFWAARKHYKKTKK